MPGISDHDAITFHFDINKHSTSSVKQHKVPLYYRGNTELIKQDLAAFANNFLSSDNQICRTALARIQAGRSEGCF